MFSSHLDGEMDSDVRSDFKSHLASCAECASDLELFQTTITTLHSIPQTIPPADFLPGIHAKLESSPLNKIQLWFSFMGQHKFAASTALATMMVAVISTTVLQLGPTSSVSTDLTGNIEQASLTTPATSQTHNYYPGVPYLAQNKAQTSQVVSRPTMQFASTGNLNSRSSYQPNLTDRAPPLFNTAPKSLAMSQYNQLSPVSPDISVSLCPTTIDQQQTLIHQLVDHSVWLPQMYGNTIHIKLPASQLSSLQKVFAPANPQICKADLAHINRHHHSGRLLNVAVTFRK